MGFEHGHARFLVVLRRGQHRRADLVCLDLIGMFDSGKAAHKLHAEVPKLARHWLGHVERRLEDREWISVRDFKRAHALTAQAP